MGALLGLLFGVGAMLVWRSGPRRPAKAPRRGPTLSERLSDVLSQAGIEAVTPRQLIGSSIGLAAVVFALSAAVSRTVPIAMAFASFAAVGPLTVVRHRQRKRRTELRDVWPEAVDNLASAVRAGLSLPEALSQLGVRGPQELRRPFQRFAEDYRATGRFSECLDRLKTTLADPTGDRIVESLRLAREVGGSDLGRLLRTLSAFLREDARTRAELETRQGWAVNTVHALVTMNISLHQTCAAPKNARPSSCAPTSLRPLHSLVHEQVTWTGKQALRTLSSAAAGLRWEPGRSPSHR